MSFEIKPATRQGVIPWIDLYSESGCGKTYSSLLLARGIAGPSGKIGMLDSESGRGGLYADVIPGGYSIVNIEPPFNPARYIEALTVLFKSGAAVVVVDSMSHEWEGIGGVTDMAVANEEKSGRQGLHNWKGPKMEHAKLVQFLLRSPVPVICCVRAKHKTRQIKGMPELADAGAIRRDQIGKTVILKDEDPSPIQAEDFIFESTAHALILKDHTIILTKCSHPDLRKCFPLDGKAPLTIEHGQAIARWCQTPGGPGTKAPAEKSDPEIDRLKKELWKMTESKHGKDKARFRQYLVDEMLIAPEDEIEKFTAANLQAVITNTAKKLQPA